MLVRLLFVVLACGVLAVSRVLIVQGDGSQAPSILSLLPVVFGPGGEDQLLESPSDFGRGGGGAGRITSSSLKRRKKFPFLPAAKKHSAAALDALDAQGARGSLQAFRRTLRSQLGVSVGRVSRLGERIGSRLRSKGGEGSDGQGGGGGRGRLGGLLGGLRRLRNRGQDQDGQRGPGVGVFAERLLRQLVNRAQQTSASLAGAAAGLAAGSTNGVDDRYVHLIRALEVEAHRALGDEEWKPVSAKEDLKLWRRAAAEGGYGKEYPCLKLSTTLDAPPEAVMALLVDSDRVAEYNKYSKGRHDVEQLGPNTKIVRNRTLPPLQKKVHEFCTIMHVVRREDGSQVMLTRFTEHPKVPRSSNYARSEIILGVTEVRAHPNDPTKTQFTTVSHVKSAGVPPFIAEQFSGRGLMEFAQSVQAAIANARRGGGRGGARAGVAEEEEEQQQQQQLPPDSEAALLEDRARLQPAQAA